MTLRLAGRKYIGFENALAEQARAFAAANPSAPAIDLTFFEVEELYDLMVKQSTAARPDFDLMMVPGDFYPTMIHRALLRDIAPFVAANPPEDWPHAWHPALRAYQEPALASFSSTPGIFGLPYHTGPEMLIYRRDLFEAHNIQPPATWDDFLAAAQKLNSPPDHWGTILAAFPDAHNICYDFYLQLWSRGGELFDDAGAPIFNTPLGLDSLQYLLDLVHRHKVAPPESLEIDSVASGQWFAQGRVAMMVNWMGFASYANEAPDSPVRGKVATAPLPAGVGPHASSASLNNYWCLALTAGSAQPEPAYAFLRHCASPAMDQITMAHGCIACRRDSWAAARKQNLTGYDQIDTVLQAARTLPLLPNYGPMGDIISEELGHAWQRKISPAQALETATQRILELK